MKLGLITNYMPQKNNKMEGGCAGGGTRPMNPCRYLFEDAIAGTSDCVVAATQRHGGSAPLYGCKTEVKAVSEVAGKPLKVCFADVYADSENEGQIGVGGKRNPSKIDLAVKIGSTLGPQVQSKSGVGVDVACDGKVDGTENGTNRTVQRDPEAQKPEPSSGASGGGAPPGGGGAPPSQDSGQPKDEIGDTSPTPDSPRTAASVKLDAPKPKGHEVQGISPVPRSEITKSRPTPLPAPVDPKEGTTVAAFMERSLAKSGPAESLSQLSAAGGGFGSSSSGSSKAPGAEGGKTSEAAQEGNSLGAGGSGGWQGGSSRASESSSASSDAAGVGSEEKPAAGEQGENEGASEEEMAGIAEQESNSLFTRVHDFYRRHQQKGAI